MPAQRPRAAFEPIPPSFDANKLVEQTPNFLYVDRISCDQIDEQGIQAFEQLVLLHVIIGGKPLVVDGFENRLDPWTFTPKWLRDNVGTKVEQSRNLSSKDYIALSIAHYLNNMGKLANQFFENARNYKDKTRQRIYLKDIDCPQVWHDKLQEQLPASLFYLNESTGEPGGQGATVDPNSNVPGRRLGRGIARAGDLMSSLPPDMRAENLMCYVGHEGTYTPAHREMCATMGHNIMVEASGEVSEDGKPEKPGSSIWFMTESKDRNTVSEYWLSVLGHDIEVETHFAQILAWKKAPFNVYVVEQKPGDFILIPPLAPHQVWNRGTRTMKVAWNRTTVETLEMALSEALPKARIVCRDEQYKNKAIVYYTLVKYSALLASAKAQADKLPPDAGRQLMSSHKIKQLIKDFKRLLIMFKGILLSEMFSPDGPQEKCEFFPFDSNVTCAYCRGNIFNRFLSCPSCKDALGHTDDEPYDVCMDCYAMGRSCGCISNLKWTEQFKWKELTRKYDAWREQIIHLDGGRISSRTPLSLLDERRKLPHRTLAEVCKDQLKKRPFVDANKTKARNEEDESEEDIIVDDEGRVKKTVKKRSKTWLKTHSPCHVCCKRHPNWKSAKCTTCEKWWCYGSLFRGADVMPITIMENPNWSCPHCRNVCFAGNCRKDPKQTPYEPKGTLLGHDTRKVADARSVECLVDFSVSNLNWLRDDEDAGESARIRRAREEAQLAKAVDPQIEDEEERDDEVEETQVNFEYSPDSTPIDPQLSIGLQASTGHSLDPMIDPSLEGDSNLLLSLSRANKALPPPSEMLRGAKPARNISAPFVPSGYAPALTNGFVAPSAVMHQQHEPHDGYTYPDPTEDYHPLEEEVDHFQPRRSKSRPSKGSNKRAHDAEDGDEINMDALPKRRRVLEDASLATSKPRNEATKQFEREKERKALEEAKKQGRFIAVQAALRGKKRIVKLPIPRARLPEILTLQTAGHSQRSPVITAHLEEGPEPETTVLLRSDVAPAIEQAKKSAGSSKMKVRVEKDDDYGMRHDRHQRGEGKRRRNATKDYEEVDIATEDEGDDNEAARLARGSSNTATTSKAGKRRVSAYIQRKHQDDPDLPDELPENFKDSSVTRRRAQVNASGRRIRPVSKTPEVSAPSIPEFGPTMEDQDDAEAEDDDAFVDQDIMTTEEANRRAKLEALSMLEADSAPTPQLQQRVPVARMGSGTSRGLSDHADGESESDGPDVIPAVAPRPRRDL